MGNMNKHRKLEISQEMEKLHARLGFILNMHENEV
jgi:hypothetical protein